MIKISFIAPTSLIPQYGNQGDFHLALAHLLGPVDEAPNEYEQAVVSSGLPIILDNGLFENKISIPVRELMEKAVHLNATHVFAPDVLFDRASTELNIDEAYEILEEIKKDFPECQTKLAAVVQANNADDFLASYLTMTDDSRIDLIGLSILSVPESFKEISGTDDITINRIICLKRLNKLSVHKNSHLLGLGGSYEDVAYANEHCPFVVSHDSSSAVWNGVQGKQINKTSLKVDGGKTKVHVDFNFAEELTEQQTANIEHNINVVKSVIK